MSDTTYVQHTGYQCTFQDYDVTKQFDSIVGLDSHMASVRPGMILEGNGVRNGVFNPIPLPRSPLTLSIDLPIKNPTRTITNPNSATIQQAIAELQAEADAELSADALRSSFTHTTQVVESLEDAAFFFGVDLKYSGPLFSAGMSASFEQTRTAGTQSFAVKHVEELYTITLADDAIAKESDFFAPSVSLADIQALEAVGQLGPDNPPVYVKSVTFGRAVLATAQAQQQFDSQELGLTVQGGAFGVSADAKYTNAYKTLASSSSFQLLALGGSAAEAQKALAAAQITDIFGAARAGTAVPLYYKMHFLEGARKPAKVGSATKYTAEECAPVGAEPCGTTCAAGWTWNGTLCTESAIYGGTASVWDSSGLHAGGGFTVPAPTFASAAYVCVDAGYQDGGIFDDGQHAFDVYCGGLRMNVNRNEITGNGGARHKRWCWDNVPVNTVCSVDNLGGGWTPIFQGAGRVNVAFSTQSMETASRCYADQWQ